MIKKLFFSLILGVISAAAQTTVTFPNAGIYLSPYTWRTASGAAIAPTGGAYMKFVLTTGSGCGTSCGLTINADTTINSGLSSAANYPAIKWHCDTAAIPGTWTWTQFPNNNSASTAVVLSSSLSASTAYTCYLFAGGGNQIDGNGWTGTTFQTKINSLTLDTGATVTLPSILPNLCLFMGASYEEGYFGGTQTGAYYTAVDPEQTWAQGVAQATVLNCEYGLIGDGSQGFQNAGNGGYPVFGSTWDHYDSTHAKAFSTPPTYVIVHEAENDTAYSAATETSVVSAWISSARSAFGSSAYIFMIGGQSSNSATINSGVQQGIVNSGDSHTFWIPWGTQWGLTVRGGCTPSASASWAAPDCLHLLPVYQSQMFGNTITAFVMKTLYRQQYAPTHVMLGSVMWPGWIACVIFVALAGLRTVRRIFAGFPLR